MQKNDLVLKRKVLIDGQELPGLVESPEINDEENVIEVPSFSRIKSVKSGISKFSPLDLSYKVDRSSKTAKFFYDWKNKNEYHDVTIINTDATGSEYDRWNLPDCECAMFKEKPYNAASPEYFGFTARITCTGTPVYLQA